jgi:hypothetical protein
MTMTIGSPGKKSAEEGRKEEAPESQKCQQWQTITRKKPTTTQLT